jgi:hypothetical protein
LGQLFKEILVVDGLEISLLWKFLQKILQINLVGQLRASDIYEIIIYPYCRGEMFAAVTQANKSKEDFNAFHERILK